jgi:hypothetical protein
MGNAPGPLAWDAHLDRWSVQAENRTGHSIDLHVQAADDPVSLRTAE